MSEILRKNNNFSKYSKLSISASVHVKRLNLTVLSLQINSEYLSEIAHQLRKLL